MTLTRGQHLNMNSTLFSAIFPVTIIILHQNKTFAVTCHSDMPISDCMAQADMGTRRYTRNHVLFSLITKTTCCLIMSYNAVSGLKAKQCILSQLSSATPLIFDVSSFGIPKIVSYCTLCVKQHFLNCRPSLTGFTSLRGNCVLCFYIGTAVFVR